MERRNESRKDRFDDDKRASDEVIRNLPAIAAFLLAREERERRPTDRI